MLQYMDEVNKWDIKPTLLYFNAFIANFQQFSTLIINCIADSEQVFVD